MTRVLPILVVLVATLLTSTASAHEPFPLATAFFRARANVAALRVARAQQPIVVQKVVKQQVVQQFVQPAYVAPIVQQYQAFAAPVVQYQVAPVQAYVAPIQKVQAVHGGCAAFFSY